MGQAKRPTCPDCGAYLTLALPPDGNGPRTFQCLDCNRPDPLNRPRNRLALRWARQGSAARSRVRPPQLAASSLGSVSTWANASRRARRRSRQWWTSIPQDATSISISSLASNSSNGFLQTLKWEKYEQWRDWFDAEKTVWSQHGS